MVGKKSVIETGVDKLVKLVSQFKKLSVKQAAKELGVSVSSVEEWADFLEEEGIISIQSQFATVYLVEKNIGKKEIAEKVKAVKDEKEHFMRRVESSINALERDSEEIKLIDSEFKQIRSMLETNFATLSKKLCRLEDFKNSHKEMEAKKREVEEEYEGQIKKVEKRLKDEHNSYDKMLGGIDEELQKIKAERDKIAQLKTTENDMRSKVNEINAMIETAKKEIQKGNEQLSIDEERLKTAEQSAKAIRVELAASSKELDDVTNNVHKSRKELQAMEKDFFRDIDALKRGDLDKIGPYKESRHLMEKLKIFFEQTKDLDKLIAKAEQEEVEMREHFQKMAKKVTAFSVLTSVPEVKKEMSDLHKELVEIETRKSLLGTQLKKLRSVMRAVVK